jgi:hypothetical protein
MLDLSTHKGPFDIALPYGLSVTVRPLTTAGTVAAQAAARRRDGARDPGWWPRTDGLQSVTLVAFGDYHRR